MRQMKYWFCFVLLLVIANTLNAQITGRIINKEYEPIQYATISLYDRDTVFIARTITDSIGSFDFTYNGLPFFLEIQHISYEKTKRLFSSSLCGNIIIEEQKKTLNEVVVKGKRSVVSLSRSGELVYSASAIRERYTVNTAYDLIRKLPGVLHLDDGNLSLIGANNLKVIINGRPSSMSQEQLYALLQSLPSERVTSLKVLYNPPPKYQTRGAIIDVVLSKAIKFQGEVHGEYQTRYTDTWKSGGSITLPWKNAGFDFSYELSSLGKQTEIKFEGTHNLKGIRHSVHQQQSIIGRENNHQIHMGLDLSLTEQSKLNVAYNGAFSPKGNTQTHSLGNLFSSQNLKNGEHKANNIFVQYQHDKGLSVDVDYTSYTLKQKQSITHKQGGNINAFDVYSNQNVNRVLFSVDKSISINNFGTLNFGSSYSFSESQDNSTYRVIQGSPKNNSKFQLKEHVYSIYTGIEKSFSDKLTATAYLTAEYYQRNNIKMWNFFPQGSLTYIISQNHIFQSTFSSEKIYPSYWEMQNAINYIDGYSEIHGNPKLLPMQRYHGTLMYMLKQKYIAQLFYTHTDNYFKQSAYQSPEVFKLLYETKNWDYSRTLGLNMIIPLQFYNPINHRLTLVISNSDILSKDFYSHYINRNKWVGLIQLDNSIIVSSSPNITFELSGYYQTPAIQTIYDLGAIWACDLGLKYTSPSKALSISLTANDLFETSVPKAKSQWNTQDFIVDTGFKTRSFMLRLSYNFGGYKKKEQKGVDMSRLGF